MQVPVSARLPLKTAHSILTSNRVQRWAGLITSFLAGQGTVQLINLITGFLLLRWMSVEAYAQYSVAFSFQSTLGMLVDLGFSGSIIALVGDQGTDAEVVGRYIRSARYFRNRLLILMLPLAAIAFPLFVAKHNWPLITQALLFISIVFALYFQGRASFYSTPLLITQRVNRYYRPQIISAAGRFLSCLFLYFGTVLSSWATAWVSAAVIAVNGFIYQKETKALVVEPVHSAPQANREMLRYLSPVIPSVIFWAFQGQISILLITLFGQTRSIAEVAALGRLGQLFLILGAFNSVIISPYIAKVARPHLARRYLQIVVTTMAISTSLCLAAFLFPEPFLWILGSKYQNLRVEVSWLIALASLNYAGGVIWTMNSARKWIYWWATIAQISLMIVTQIICVSVMNLNSTLNVIYFSLITISVVTLMHIATGIYGFKYGPRVLKHER